MPETPSSRFENPSTPPASDAGFQARRLPGTPAGEAQGMLPGMAMIAMYLLLVGLLNAFAAVRGVFGAGTARYAILSVCTLTVIGVFGMLRLRRWGWAIATAGCLLMALSYFFGYHRAHRAPYLVMGLFAFLFFLYLSRTEVRERLR